MEGKNNNNNNNNNTKGTCCKDTSFSTLRRIFRGIVCWVAQLNTAFALVPERKIKKNK